MTESLKGVVAFTVTDKGALYASYMRFVQNGGVFVPTSRQYDLGDKVFLLLQVMDDPSPIPLRGEVAWICLLYTSPSPRDRQKSRMPSSA